MRRDVLPPGWEPPELPERPSWVTMTAIVLVVLAAVAVICGTTLLVLMAGAVML